jgi:hypothetical protein
MNKVLHIRRDRRKAKQNPRRLGKATWSKIGHGGSGQKGTFQSTIDQERLKHLRSIHEGVIRARLRKKRDSTGCDGTSGVPEQDGGKGPSQE